ncbi:MAG: tryptophan 2,3-dioxygenase family protein [Thermonemataceae bacterium]|nr:tryptophan 2,3-dioxygenase family protein [Thermonemataceae bacterium]
MDTTINALLEKLEDKYSQTGQNLAANLEGLLYNDYLKYWDYIHLDTLLTLQKPKTHFPDEKIFIIYHQITELYFKLILWEIEQVAEKETITAAFFTEKLQRINRYIKALTDSFDIMSMGMEPEQFKQFRMALLPASGFQSAQFRLIEIAATDFFNLTCSSFRTTENSQTSIEEMYEQIYWKKGATETKTGKKTITLQHFEEKYTALFLEKAYFFQKRNLWQRYQELEQKEGENAQIKEIMQELDYNFNIEWALSHLKSAVRYLKEQNKLVDATGGTNWTKYLPPNFQKVIFFPKLWSEQEKQEWGRRKVEAMLNI